MPDPLTEHWSVSPAPVPLPGADHHWLLTPCCDTTGVTGMTGLPAEVREAFWDALDELTGDVPGYSFAVQPGEVVVHVVAGGRATFEFKPAPKVDLPERGQAEDPGAEQRQPEAHERVVDDGAQT